MEEGSRYASPYGSPAPARELKKVIEACRRPVHALPVQESPAE